MATRRGAGRWRAGRDAASLLVCALLVGCAPDASDSGGTEAPSVVASVGDADGPRVTLRASALTITTAQRLTIGLDIDLPPGAKLEEPDLSKLLPSGLTLVAQKAELPGLGPNGSTLERRQYVLEPFLPGTVEFPSLEIRATRDKGGPLVVHTEPLRVTVTSVLTEATQKEGLASEKGVVDPPERPAWWFIAGVAALTLIAGAVGTWLIARSRRERAPEITRRAAHILALERLRELEARGLVESGQLKEFYQEASLVLRRYIEDRFGLMAPERTTEEFLQECPAAPEFTQQDVGTLERFLRHCDMVKFAGLEVSGEQARAIALSVREFVERTKREDRLVEIPREAAA